MFEFFFYDTSIYKIFVANYGTSSITKYKIGTIKWTKTVFETTKNLFWFVEIQREVNYPYPYNILDFL